MRSASDFAVYRPNWPSREVAMAEPLERRLDLTLDTREELRSHHQAELAQRERAIRDSHAELDGRQMRFCTEVRCLMQDIIEQANRHLATRAEKCQFYEVPGYFTGPLYVGGSPCNPLAYELRLDGQEVGETLILELTHDGMIEAFLGPFRPCRREADTTRIDFGWHRIPLYAFDAGSASELLISYMTTVTMRWQLNREDRDGMMEYCKRRILS